MRCEREIGGRREITARWIIGRGEGERGEGMGGGVEGNGEGRGMEWGGEEG